MLAHSETISGGDDLYTALWRLRRRYRAFRDQFTQAEQLRLCWWHWYVRRHVHPTLIASGGYDYPHDAETASSQSSTDDA